MHSGCFQNPHSPQIFKLHAPVYKAFRKGWKRNDTLCNFAAYSGFNWVPFTVTDQAVVTPDFSDQDMERFYVKMPCQDTVWFKLFLNRDDGQNSHVELFSRVSLTISWDSPNNKLNVLAQYVSHDLV